MAAPPHGSPKVIFLEERQVGQPARVHDGRFFGFLGVPWISPARGSVEGRTLQMNELDRLKAALAAARLTHPYILPLHDSGEADGFLYYVMP